MDIRNSFMDIQNSFTDIRNEFRISVNELRISVNEFRISVNIDYLQGMLAISYPTVEGRHSFSKLLI